MDNRLNNMPQENVIDAMVKKANNILGDIITVHIQKDAFDDRRPEIRRFLTSIEVAFNKDFETYATVIKERLAEEFKIGGNRG